MLSLYEFFSLINQISILLNKDGYLIRKKKEYQNLKLTKEHFKAHFSLYCYLHFE